MSVKSLAKRATHRLIGPMDRMVSVVLPVGGSHHSPSVIAHRGLPGEFRENSIQGLRAAIERGADGVEFDVVFADQVPRVAHDLPVSNAPTLRDTLLALAGNTQHIYVHYKHSNEDLSDDVNCHVSSIAEAVKEAGVVDSVVVMVESGDVDPWLRNAPQLHVLACWTGPFDRVGRRPVRDSVNRGLQHLGYYHHPTQLSRIGSIVHRLGAPRLGAWIGGKPIRRMLDETRDRTWVAFTVNDEFLMRLFSSMGFDAVGTDISGLFREVVVGDDALNRRRLQ